MLWFFKTKLKHILHKYGSEDIEKSQIPLFTHKNAKRNYPSKYTQDNYEGNKAYVIRNIFCKPVGMFITQSTIDKLKLSYPIVRHFEIFKKYCGTQHHYGTRALRKIIKKYKKFVLQANDENLIKYYEKNGFTLYSKTGNIMTIDTKKKKLKL